MEGNIRKRCELCKAAARLHCESDEAALCWDCDAAVHGANFLVARHVRALLCRTCQSPTAWQASGVRVGPAASVCQRCLQGLERNGRAEEGEGENQVVPPWPLSPPPPLTSSSSGSRESLSGDVSSETTQEGELSSSSGSSRVYQLSKRRKRSSAPQLANQRELGIGS